MHKMKNQPKSPPDAAFSWRAAATCSATSRSVGGPNLEGDGSATACSTRWRSGLDLGAQWDGESWKKLAVTDSILHSSSTLGGDREQIRAIPEGTPAKS